MTCHAALDVGIRSLALCIIVDDGKVRLERNRPAEVVDVVACLSTACRHGNPPDIGLDMVGFRCAGDPKP